MLKVNAYRNVPSTIIESASMRKVAKAQESSGVDGLKPTQKVERSFANELTKAGSRGITISKHAAQRLHSRGVTISAERMEQLSRAVDKAEEKGSRETLALADDAAFVISVPNRVMITAFDRDNLREGVVTSIDSAVIL